MLYLLSLQHDHSFIWIFHARNIDHLNDPERFELVKFMLTLGLARNTT